MRFIRKEGPGSWILGLGFVRAWFFVLGTLCLSVPASGRLQHRESDLKLLAADYADAQMAFAILTQVDFH